ncbi:MAG TPA: hypothetical protein PKA90_02180 [Ignavibacteria bacterium]|nr:hypothetical protein [Ignavibacteria bacterium]HMR39216.1 hypothetical protein [Ignavibacteria bacterium]
MNNNFLKVLLFILIIIFLKSGKSFSQNKPFLQITTGLSFPGNSLAGDLVTTTENGFIFVNEEFVKNNYAASTGLNVSGILKFPLESKGVLLAALTGSYTSFNTFRRSDLGITVVNNIEDDVNLESNFSVSTFAMGLEVSPSPNSAVNPFINSSISLNLLALSLTRNDALDIIFSDSFRMGLLSNAGVNIRINKEYYFTISAGYHFSNLFFKSGSNTFEDRVTYSRENIPINDEEGSFYTNLSNPNIAPQYVNGTTKKVNWLIFNLGINIILGK